MQEQLRIVGCDPGPYESAYCLLVDGQPEDAGKIDNDALLRLIESSNFGEVRYVIETIFPRGQSVGLETFDTQFWAGRYAQAARTCRHKWEKIDRQDVRFAICGSLATNDSSVRQGLIDHYGGEHKAIGGKRCKLCKNGNMGTAKRPLQCTSCGGDGWQYPPGPLKKFAKDMWSALAIALAVHLRITRDAVAPARAG